mmetsp:Transcript_39887/g.125562  ORF Transcript_39887/g.125562 Transcript_39887/m.125562 type:complete len:216 (+) Transcript_39887:55-702(+)
MVSLEGLCSVEVELEDIEVFKCLGDEESLEEYVAAHPPRVPGDWSALYTQFNAPHSLGTVGYRWDAGYGLARLVRARIPRVKGVVVDAPWMPDGAVAGEAKAKAVRQALGLPEGGPPLMERLGERGQVLVCRETADQWELVVPRALMASLSWQQRAVCELRPNRYGMTGEWREREEGEGEGWGAWRRFDEVEALRDVEPPSWIARSLGTEPAEPQ